MEKIFEALDLAKIAAGLSPAAMIAIWRSFYMRGAFPSIGKDDIGPLIIIAATYYLFLRTMGIDSLQKNFLEQHNYFYSIFFLLILPSLIGIALGWLEAEDRIGKLLRKARLRVPHPQTTAWQDIFRELQEWDFVIIYTERETITGRWAPGSSASLDPDHLDLFLSEHGTLDQSGNYSPKSPQRGFFVKAEQIQGLEIIRVPTGGSDDRETFLAKFGRGYRKAIGA